MPFSAVSGLPPFKPVIAKGKQQTAGPAGPSPAGIQGVCIGFTDPWNAVNPTWTRIDDPAGVWTVTGWTIDRGRSYELDKTATGTATVDIIDTHGLFDPTNSTSPYYQLVQPLKQAVIALQNPYNGTWTTLFRGFVEDWTYTLDVSEQFFTLQLNLVDALDIFASIEVVPGTFGALIPAGSGVSGDVLYISQQVNDRILAALADAKWPVGYSNIFSGNVAVQDVVYAPRSQILSVIQDAADAEFPGVANFFVAKDGRPTFHGRLARFNPSAYGIGSWACGDTAATTGNSALAPLSGLTFNLGLANVINGALATPQMAQGLSQEAIDQATAGNLAVDAASIGAYGVRSWSAENLITKQGDETGTPSALAETYKFSQYYVDNYASPQTRINQLTFRPQNPTGPLGNSLWSLMCGVEISDQIAVTTTHPGGGGFQAAPYFVEGIHYQAAPLNGTMHDVTLTLDVSPQAWFTQNPFG